jgi:hypothetical protein
MKGLAAESGARAEAIVFLEYFKEFPDTRQAGFVGLAKFPPSYLLAVQVEAKSFAAMARSYGRNRTSRPPAEGRARHEDAYPVAAPGQAPK